MIKYLSSLTDNQLLLILTALLVVLTFILVVISIKLIKRPKPVVTIDEEEGVLKYKNIGGDSAIRIQTEEINLNLFRILFPPTNLLKPNDKKALVPKISSKSSDVEYSLEVWEDLDVKLFPYFEELGVVFYNLVTQYENLKGKKYLSVVLVRCKAKKIEHKLNGPKWWIDFLDKFKLIRNFPKPPKDAHLYKS